MRTGPRRGFPVSTLLWIVIIAVIVGRRFLLHASAGRCRRPIAGGLAGRGAALGRDCSAGRSIRSIPRTTRPPGRRWPTRPSGSTPPARRSSRPSRCSSTGWRSRPPTRVCITSVPPAPRSASIPGPSCRPSPGSSRPAQVSEDRSVNVEGREYEASPKPGAEHPALLPGRHGGRSARAAGLVLRTLVEARPGRRCLGRRQLPRRVHAVLRNGRDGRRLRVRVGYDAGFADAEQADGGDGGGWWRRWRWRRCRWRLTGGDSVAVTSAAATSAAAATSVAAATSSF